MDTKRQVLLLLVSCTSMQSQTIPGRLLTVDRLAIPQFCIELQNARNSSSRVAVSTGLSQEQAAHPLMSVLCAGRASAPTRGKRKVPQRAQRQGQA